MKVQVLIGGVPYLVEVEDSELGRSASSEIPALLGTANAKSSVLRTGDSDLVTELDPKICRSPVSGIVTRVLIGSGEEVQAHDLMLVLEAMKMETNVEAPLSGKVKSVNVAPGEAVKIGQVLLEFV